MEHALQSMQFGSRKQRSTSTALSCIRRVAHQGERTGLSTYLLLLGWKHAFDKVTGALRRMGTSPKLQRLIERLYEEPRFC
eukprot:18571-Prorocentrum_lima.AAC.1